MNGYSSLDSSVTLVNPSPPVELAFDKNSVISTTVRQDGQPAYKISHVNGTTITILDVRTQEVIIVIEDRDLLPNVVKIKSLNGGKSIRTKKWLVEGRLQAEEVVIRTIETMYGRFVWRMSPEYRLLLTREDAMDKPVAYLRPGASAPVLVIDNEAMVLVDQILASFIIQEMALRADERRSQNARSVMNGLAFSVTDG